MILTFKIIFSCSTTTEYAAFQLQKCGRSNMFTAAKTFEKAKRAITREQNRPRGVAWLRGSPYRIMILLSSHSPSVEARKREPTQAMRTARRKAGSQKAMMRTNRRLECSRSVRVRAANRAVTFHQTNIFERRDVICNV